MRSSAVAWPLAILVATSPVLLSTSASAGTIAYSYDQLGRLTSVVYPSGAIIRYNYDKNGNRTSYVVTGSTNPVPSGTAPVGQAAVVSTASSQPAPASPAQPATNNGAR